MTLYVIVDVRYLSQVGKEVVMSMTIAIQRQERNTRRRTDTLDQHRSLVGMDLMDESVDAIESDEVPGWLEKLTCTPLGIVGLVCLTIVLSPVLVVFGAFYGACKPFGR